MTKQKKTLNIERNEYTVSTSRETRIRQELANKGYTEKQIMKKIEADESRRHTIKYGFGALAFVIVFAAMLVYNSGIIQSKAVAATIDGVDYNAGYMQYYYGSVAENEVYAAYNGQSAFNPGIDPSEQIQDKETGTTYHDYFIAQSLETAQSTIALCKAADAAGFVLDEEALKVQSDAMASLSTQAIVNGFSNVEGYLQGTYGPYMTIEIFENLFEQQVISAYYSRQYLESLEYSSDEYDAYYTENKNVLDSYELSHVLLRAEVEDKTDADGKKIELTEEELKAALAEVNATVSAQADEIETALKADENAEELGKKYDAFGAYESEQVVGSVVNTSYAEWAMDADRKAGDTTIATYEGADFTMYYVVKFEGRAQDNTATADIRHMLIAAELDDGVGIPTEAQYAASKEKAEKILAEWNAGDATEDSFAALVTANTADTASAASGGLLTGISANSNYVVTDWSLDESRTVGDAGIVKNDKSNIKGHHVVYFQAWGEPVWKITAESAMIEADFTAWSQALVADVTATLGSGTKHISM